jgi:hypothetical protein
MEGNIDTDDGIFDFFKGFKFDGEDEFFDVFPFKDYEEQNDEGNFNFIIFPEIQDPLFDNHKHLMDQDQLLEKITKCEQNYNNIIHSNMIASPTISVKDKIAENFEMNMNMIEGTLPGLLISIMYKENTPVNENFLLSRIFSKFEDLRKVNGSKYNVNFIVIY